MNISIDDYMNDKSLLSPFIWLICEKNIIIIFFNPKYIKWLLRVKS